MLDYVGERPRQQEETRKHHDQSDPRSPHARRTHVPAGAAWAHPRRSPGIVVKVGERRSFTRAELRPGATVKCTYGGHSLSPDRRPGSWRAGAASPRPAAGLLPERDRQTGRRVHGDRQARRLRARDLGRSRPASKAHTGLGCPSGRDFSARTGARTRRASATTLTRVTRAVEPNRLSLAGRHTPSGVLPRKPHDQLTNLLRRRGPPGRRCGSVQLRATSSRCQRKSVPGFTNNDGPRLPRQHAAEGRQQRPVTASTADRKRSTTSPGGRRSDQAEKRAPASSSRTMTSALQVESAGLQARPVSAPHGMSVLRIVAGSAPSRAAGRRSLGGLRGGCRRASDHELGKNTEPERCRTAHNALFVAAAWAVADGPFALACEPRSGGFAQRYLARSSHRPAVDRRLRRCAPRPGLGEGRERLLDPATVAGAPDARLVRRAAVAIAS